MSLFNLSPFLRLRNLYFPQHSQISEEQHLLYQVFEANDLTCFHVLSFEYPERNSYLLTDCKQNMPQQYICENVKNTSYFLRLNKKALILILTIIDDNSPFDKRCNLQVYISSNSRTIEYCDPQHLEELEEMFNPIDIHIFIPFWCKYCELTNCLNNILYGYKKFDIKDGVICHDYFLPDLGLYPPCAATNNLISTDIEKKLNYEVIYCHISETTKISISSRRFQTLLEY